MERRLADQERQELQRHNAEITEQRTLLSEARESFGDNACAVEAKMQQISELSESVHRQSNQIAEAHRVAAEAKEDAQRMSEQNALRHAELKKLANDLDAQRSQIHEERARFETDRLALLRDKQQLLKDQDAFKIEVENARRTSTNVSYESSHGLRTRARGDIDAQTAQQKRQFHRSVSQPIVHHIPPKNDPKCGKASHKDFCHHEHVSRGLKELEDDAAQLRQYVCADQEDYLASFHESITLPVRGSTGAAEATHSAANHTEQMNSDSISQLLDQFSIGDCREDGHLLPRSTSTQSASLLGDSSCRARRHSADAPSARQSPATTSAADPSSWESSVRNQLRQRAKYGDSFAGDFSSFLTLQSLSTSSMIGEQATRK